MSTLIRITNNFWITYNLCLRSIVNLTSSIFDIDCRYGFTWQLPRTYLAIEAKRENIDKFLNTFTNGNPQLKDIEIASCQAALIGRADLQKFLYLFGLPDEWVTATIRGAGSVEAVKQLNGEMTVREDSIAAFFDEKLIIDPSDSIGCGALYSLYKSYCDDSGLKPKSIKNFTPSLVELCNDSLGHSITHKQT